MSTTLTNGIIIPDNGNRNWGGDLANNWNIIDLNVGYMTDVKNKVTTLENSVAENTANIQTNASNISALQTDKQDVIEDLETIRAGASAGATAVQPNALNNYYNKTEVDTALTSKANDSDVVHKSGDVMSGDLLGVGSNNLGTSTNKWKTLNGINPGALSLPNISSSGTNSWIALDTSDWVKYASTTAAQKYTPLAHGWLNVRVDGATMLAMAGGGNYMHQMIRSETPNSLALLMPVHKDVQVAIMVSGNENLAYNRVTFYYCQGNV